MEDEGSSQGLAGLPLGLPGPQGCRPLPGPLPGQALLGVQAGLAAQQLIILFRPLPGDAKSLGPMNSSPKPVRPVVWEKETWEGQQEMPEAAAPSQPRERSLWGSGYNGQTLRQTDGWTLVLPMGLGRGQSPVLMALLLLLACLKG